MALELDGDDWLETDTTDGLGPTIISGTVSVSSIARGKLEIDKLDDSACTL